MLFQCYSPSSSNWKGSAKDLSWSLESKTSFINSMGKSGLSNAHFPNLAQYSIWFGIERNSADATFFAS